MTLLMGTLRADTVRILYVLGMGIRKVTEKSNIFKLLMWQKTYLEAGVICRFVFKLPTRQKTLCPGQGAAGSISKLPMRQKTTPVGPAGLFVWHGDMLPVGSWLAFNRLFVNACYKLVKVMVVFGCCRIAPAYP